MSVAAVTETPARLPRKAGQMDLFEAMLDIYAESAEAVANGALYQALTMKAGVDAAIWDARQPVGTSGEEHCPAKVQCRWWQQTARAMGLIERVPNSRGRWRATDKGRARVKPSEEELEPAPRELVMLGFSTKLGIALWGDCRDVFSRIDEPVHLVVTSPPYLLRNPRAYGGPTCEKAYVDFICECLEPVVARLAAGGSIALNVTNDSFLPGMPARSLYMERLVIALHERMGLFKAETIVWHDDSKPPSPIRWSSINRQLPRVAYEPILWLTNDPSRLFSDNRRVLQSHTARHKRLMAAGGEKRTAVYGDGANRIRQGSFGKETEGRLPTNVLTIGHRDPSQDELRRELPRLGLPVHGATMPKRVARWLIDLMTEPGQLVVDTFSGWATTAVAAEEAGRRWIVAERMRAYLQGAAYRMREADGFAPGPAVLG